MKKDKTYSLENIIDLTGGDKDFISVMIHMFISQADTFNKDIETALYSSDIDFLKHKAHKFKTSAQLFQIMDLHSLLAKLESFADLSQKKELDEVLKEIEKKSSEAVQQLKEELKNY